MKAGSFFAGLLTGAAIGGILALLYAPRSGKETREQLRQKLGEFEKEVEDLKARAGRKAGQVKEDIASRLADLQKEIENIANAI